MPKVQISKDWLNVCLDFIVLHPNCFIKKAMHQCIQGHFQISVFSMCQVQSPKILNYLPCCYVITTTLKNIVTEGKHIYSDDIFIEF